MNLTIVDEKEFWAIYKPIAKPNGEYTWTFDEVKPWQTKYVWSLADSAMGVQALPGIHAATAFAYCVTENPVTNLETVGIWYAKESRDDQDFALLDDDRESEDYYGFPEDYYDLLEEYDGFPEDYDEQECTNATS